MPKLTIGKYDLPYGLMLAPMAGVTDHAFRRICKECGAEFTVSEMLSCDAIHYKDLKTAKLAKITRVQEPMALQIFGSDPVCMAEAAQIAIEATGADIFSAKESSSFSAPEAVTPPPA